MYTNISYADDHHFKDDKGHYLFFQNIFIKSVAITTDDVGLTPAQGEEYNIM
jgi:hypothetical protein